MWFGYWIIKGLRGEYHSPLPVPLRAYDPDVEPTRRHVIDTIKDPEWINELYREVKFTQPQASELVVWQSVLMRHQTYRPNA